MKFKKKFRLFFFIFDGVNEDKVQYLKRVQLKNSIKKKGKMGIK